MKKYSKKEIQEQIRRGDNESLGWKDKHYLGAIAKVCYNLMEGLDKDKENK